MSSVFIDTFELTYKTDFETMRKMTMKFEKYKQKDGSYVCIELSHVGFIIKTKKCSKGEAHGKGENYKVIIRADPNRILSPGTNTEHIFDEDKFEKMLERLDSFISLWFSKFDVSLDDFELTRVDITRDIHDVPEHIIQDYIQIMRRMILYDGFKLNKQLEENTTGFRHEDSFNVINESQRIEFVVYNKHRATIDQKYPDQDREYYADTLRIEARLQRKFINKYTKGLTVSETLLKMFSERDKRMEDIYNSVFQYNTNVSFLQSYWQNKFIDRKSGNRAIKKEKMKSLARIMSHKDRFTLGSVMDRLDISDDAKCTLLWYFDDIGLSPIPTINNEIPYLQSIDSILGFGVPTEMDISYYRYLKKHTRGKEVFFHESSE